MSAREYWEGDPQLVLAYKKKHEIQQELDNQAYWLQGLYNYSALRAALGEFGYSLGGCKGQKPEPYIDHPIPITKHEKEMAKERAIRETIAWMEKGMSGK